MRQVRKAGYEPANINQDTVSNVLVQGRLQMIRSSKIVMKSGRLFSDDKSYEGNKAFGVLAAMVDKIDKQEKQFDMIVSIKGTGAAIKILAVKSEAKKTTKK